MPTTHVVAVSKEIPQWVVLKHEREEPVVILQEGPSEDGPRVYVHYVNLEKRNDEWLPKSLLHPMPSTSALPNGATVPSRKRKRQSKGSASASRSQSVESEDAWKSDDVNGKATKIMTMTKRNTILKHHKKLYSRRNFDQVYIGEWLIKTLVLFARPGTSLPRIPGVSRTTIRAHGRTSDLLAGGMGRTVEKTSLYVCDMCFKYMTDASTWEVHKKDCNVNHPPGRKVYQRGAHTIWEVDGAKEKATNSLRRAGKVGTPERPLSDLGLRSYLAYWCSTLIRFFRKLLEVMPLTAGPDPIITRGAPPDFRSPTRELSSEESVTPRSSSWRRRRNKGWDGEVSEEDDDLCEDIDGMYSFLTFFASSFVVQSFILVLTRLAEKLASLRTFITTRHPHGGASVDLKIECSLEDIASATNLRVEDTAFALNEMGLLTRWGKGEGRGRGGFVDAGCKWSGVVTGDGDGEGERGKVDGYSYEREGRGDLCGEEGEESVFAFEACEALALLVGLYYSFYI
ncbi:acyl-CoA N-acyltransferase [Gymnopus androsaceus JB14]|uniref:histone acetyltransferase n=1 Tax=Gymnopus androsaceus JB14 TaxID=1447944 RepID=A0A6A4HK58_9AGAR|nr:acyl-CoA N-acyltransferase [Gymnopus androsaceus JB14]